MSIDTNAVPDPSLRAFAMWLLSRTQPPDAASALLCGAIDDDPKVRCEALAGLSGVDLPDAIDRLIAGLQDPYVNARVISALSLGGRQQAEVLVQTLQDPNQPAIDAAPQQKRSRTFVPRSNRSCEPR